MFCKNCGKEIADTAKFCDGCGVKTGEELKLIKKEEINAILLDGKNAFCSFFSKNPASLIDATQKEKSKIGIVFIILNALLFGIVICFNFTQVVNRWMQNVVSDAKSAVSYFLGNIYSSAFFSQMDDSALDVDSLPVPYEMFLPLVLVAVVISTIIIAGIYLILKIKKQSFKPFLQVCNFVGISCVPIIVALVLNFVMGFVFPAITMFIFAWGILLSLIILYESLKGVFENSKPIVETAVLFMLVIGFLMIVVTISVNKISDSFLEAISNELGSSVSFSFADIF